MLRGGSFGNNNENNLRCAARNNNNPNNRNDNIGFRVCASTFFSGSDLDTAAAAWSCRADLDRAAAAYSIYGTKFNCDPAGTAGRS